MSGLPLRIRSVMYHPVVSAILLALTMLVGVRMVLLAIELPVRESFYAGGWIGRHLTMLSLKRLVLLGVVLAGAAFWAYRFPNPLARLDAPSRWLYWALLAAQTYAVALMDYNHYFDSWYAFDRILLVVAAGVVARVPALLPFYLLQLVLLSGQLEFPHRIGYDHTHKSVTLPLLTAFWLIVSLYPLAKARLRYWYLLVVLSLAGAWYVQAGFAKWQLGWVTDNNLYNLVAGAAAFGYGGPDSWLVPVARFVDRWHQPLQLAGLVTELVLPFFCLPGRRFVRWMLVAFIGFHLLVYVLSGIFFWQWMLLEGIIFYFIVRYPQRWRTLRKAAYWVPYYLLLLAWPLSVHVTALAWLDCGFINGYYFSLVDDAGRTYRLDSSFFSPYDVGFAKNRFTYTTNNKYLTNTMGQCYDAELLRLTRAWTADTARAAVELERLRAESPYFRYNEAHRVLFHTFLRRFARNKLRYDPHWISTVDPPLHMVQGPNQQNFAPAADSLRIDYREFILLPNLEQLPYRSASLTLPLAD